MEAIVLIALILVVFTKAFTINRLSSLESKIRAAQLEEAEVGERLQSTESALRALEKEQNGVEQEIKHLENDRDLASLEITKIGGNPITEEQLDQLIAAQKNPKAPPAQSAPQPQKQDPASQEEASPPSQPAQEPASAPVQTDGSAHATVLPQSHESEGQDPETVAPSVPTSVSEEHEQEADLSKNEQQESSEEGEESEQQEGSEEEADAQPQRPRILVVDDNQELRSLLLQALAKDYEVLDSPDGYDALTKVIKDKHTYDLIITDLNMPNVNGITLLEHLPRDIPTIVISGFINKPRFHDALKRLAPAAVLEKPFQMVKLRLAIKNALKD